MTNARSRFEAIAKFTTVAQRLSFTAAAQDLGIDASVLSRRIAALEARLGVRLLQRTTRRVSLTEAGAEFLARMQDLLGRMDEAEAVVSRHAAEPTGRLRVALPNLFGQRHIAPLIPAFTARHPKLRIELTFSDRIEDLLDARIDCAIRIGALEYGGDLIARTLAPNRRLLVASPAYLKSVKTPAHPQELTEHRLLHFQPMMGGRSWRLRRDAETFELPVDPWIAADNAEALRIAAVAGQGIAMLATFVVGDDLREGHLVPVLADWRPAKGLVSIVYPNAPFLPLRVRTFIDFLVNALRGEPPWERNLTL